MKAVIEIDRAKAHASLAQPADALEFADALRDFVSAPCAEAAEAMARFGVRVWGEAER